MNYEAAHLKAIIFDLDGTLIESNAVKDRAFAKMFQSFPDHIDEIIAYHKSHNHVVRYDKIRHIYNHILKIKLSDDEFAQASLLIDDLIRSGVIECDFVHGAVDFLQYCKTRFKLFVVSMTPDSELLNILQAREMAEFFVSVYGASWKKTDAILHIMKRESLRENEVIYIGDAPEDARSADKAGVAFLGRDSGRCLLDVSDVVVKDMAEAQTKIETLDI